MRKLLISILPISFMLFSSCENTAPTSKEFQIDNPLTNDITIKIDDVEHNIPAVSSVMVDIDFGKHTLTYKNQSVNFLAKHCEQPVVMNPTLSNYIFYHEFYSDYSKANKASAELDKIEEAYLYDYDFGDGEIYQVPFKVINSLFIDRYAYYWHYGLNNPFPQVATVYEGTTNLSVTAKSKLFREIEFLEYAEEMFEEGFRFVTPEVQDLSKLEPYKLVEDEFLEFDCDAAKHIGPIVKAKFDSLTMVDSKEFGEVYYRLSRIPYDGTFNRKIEDSCEGFGYIGNMVKIGQAISTLGEKSAWVTK